MLWPCCGQPPRHYPSICLQLSISQQRHNNAPRTHQQRTKNTLIRTHQEHTTKGFSVSTSSMSNTDRGAAKLHAARLRQILNVCCNSWQEDTLHSTSNTNSTSSTSNSFAMASASRVAADQEASRERTNSLQVNYPSFPLLPQFALVRAGDVVHVPLTEQQRLVNLTDLAAGSCVVFQTPRGGSVTVRSANKT